MKCGLRAWGHGGRNCIERLEWVVVVLGEMCIEGMGAVEKRV